MPRHIGFTLFVLCLPIAVVELVLQLADARLIGSPHWRPLTYSYAALWRGLLGNWQPNFSGQALTMFFSYALVHTGLLHLSGNIVGLLAFAPRSGRHAGRAGLLLIAGVSSLTGALGFVLLSESVRPMIGASGAVYGLAAAWFYWERTSRRGAALLFAALLALNLLQWWLIGGELAWEAHIGGMVGGWFSAKWLDTRRGQRSRR